MGQDPPEHRCRSAESLLCVLKHCTKGSIDAFIYFPLQGNLYRPEETETMGVKYSGWGFSCVDPIKVNESYTSKSLHITQEPLYHEP